MSVKDKPFEWRCLAGQKILKMGFLVSAVYFHYLPSSSIETTIVQWCNYCLCDQQLLQSKRFRKPIQKNRCGLKVKFPNCSNLEEFSISSPFTSCFLQDVLNKDYFGYYILGRTSLSRKFLSVELFTKLQIFICSLSVIKAYIRFFVMAKQSQSWKMLFSSEEEETILQYVIKRHVHWALLFKDENPGYTL